MSAKILIVDDHYVVRQGVRSILAERPEWEICGEAGTGEEAVDAAATLRPDVVILDITMPEAARDLIVAVERLLAGDTFFAVEPDVQPDNKKAATAAPNSSLSSYASLCFA